MLSLQRNHQYVKFWVYTACYCMASYLSSVWGSLYFIELLHQCCNAHDVYAVWAMHDYLSRLQCLYKVYQEFIIIIVPLLYWYSQPWPAFKTIVQVACYHKFCDVGLPQTGITVMHAAALGGNMDVVKLLLTHGVYLHTTTVVITRTFSIANIMT